MRKVLLTVFAGAVVSLSGLAPPASAQGAAEALVVTALNVTAQEMGRASTQSVVLPGDVLEYRLTFTNVRDGEALGVVFTDPIPERTVYLIGTAQADRSDVAVEFSIDGGESWSSSPMVYVEEGGESVLRPAPAEAYTTIRWTLTDPVAPGARVTAAFRVTSTGEGER
jgi:uncharacterized repeat protein (TIGR01451 family)